MILLGAFRHMPSAVSVAEAVMHRPRLLILDEPTNGLDPINQQEFGRMVKEVRGEGHTVFLSQRKQLKAFSRLWYIICRSLLHAGASQGITLLGSVKTVLTS